MNDDTLLADMQNHLSEGKAISPSVLRLLACLWEKEGRIVSRETLYDWIDASRGQGYDNPLTYMGLGTLVKKLRQVIRERGWPLTVTTYPTIGYRLDLLDSSWGIVEQQQDLFK